MAQNSDPDSIWDNSSHFWNIGLVSIVTLPKCIYSNVFLHEVIFYDLQAWYIWLYILKPALYIFAPLSIVVY